MEWVVTTGRTLDEAKDLALDQLGVTEEDAEFEILEEPRPGLFGRVRGEARVRARVRPTTPRAKADRRDKRRKGAADSPAEADAPAAAEATTASARKPRAPRSAKPAAAAAAVAPDLDGDETVVDTAVAETTDRPARNSGGGDGGRRGGGTRAPRAPKPPAERTFDSEEGGPDVSAEQVGAEAVRFLDGLVSAFGLEGTGALERDGDEMEVKVTGPELGLLIGPRGATLLAIQDLTRVVSQRRLGDHETRLRIDIGGYRERRREALAKFTVQQADAAKASGQARLLEPMPSADRKVIHDTIATIDGVSSRSEGEDPFRRVVIVPDSEA